jgi:hypothetical protein
VRETDPVTTPSADADTARRTRVRRTAWALAIVALASYSLLFVMAARA